MITMGEFDLNTAQLPSLRQMPDMEGVVAKILDIRVKDSSQLSGILRLEITYDFGSDYRKVQTVLRFNDAAGQVPVMEAEEYVVVMNAFATKHNLKDFSWKHIKGAMVQVDFKNNPPYYNTWPKEVISVLPEVIEELRQ